MISTKRLALWLLLMVFAMNWGIITGIALATKDWWLNPVVGLAGCMGIWGVAFTLFIAQTTRART